MSLIVNDSFTRANSGSAGNGWTGSGFSISSNKLLVTGTGAGQYLSRGAGDNCANAHGSVTTDVITIGEIAFGIDFRAVTAGSSDFLVAAYRQGTAANWQLQVQKNGVTVTTPTSLAFTSGHAYRLDGSIIGYGASTLLSVSITDITAGGTAWTVNYLDTTTPSATQVASTIAAFAYTSGGQSFSLTNVTLTNDDAILVDPAYLQASTTGDAVLLIDPSAAWTPGTPGTPTFTRSSTGTGSSITAQTVNTAVKTTLTVSAGTAGTITYTDPGRSITATQTVAALPTATGEVQFNGTTYGTPGSFQGGTLTLASQGGQAYSGTYGDYTKAFDGDLTTGYISAITAVDYAAMDCGAAVTLTRLRLAPMNGYEERLAGARLQGATAGPTGPWTTIYTCAAPYPVRNRLTEYAVSPGAAYRWYRLLAPASDLLIVGEIRLIGTPATPAPYKPVPPTFSPNGGRYATGVRVRLASLTGGATYYYTTDGTTPVVTAGVPQGTTTLYATSILVTTNATTLKAIAVCDGNSSDVSTSAAYTTNTVNYASPMTVTDDNGNVAQLHATQIIWDATAKKYWALGMLMDLPNYNTVDIDHRNQAIVLYSSVDLVNWKFEGQVIGPDGSTLSFLGRPKMLFNVANNNWVLWACTIAYADGAVGVNTILAGIWTASTPTGTWTNISKTYNPDTKGMRDFTLYQEGTNAYLVWVATVANTNGDIWIDQLAADYKTVVGSPTNLIAGTSREAPMMFKSGSTYHLLTSVANYYDSSSVFNVHDHTCATIAGTYVDQGSPFASDPTTGSFNSQPACLLTVQGRTSGFLYLADHWQQNPLSGSSQEWLPVTFTGAGATMSIASNASWNLDTFATSSGPVAASGLSAIATSGQVALTWTNTDTTGALLAIDRATDSGFTANVVTDLLAAATASYTDTQVSNGTAYYYRIRTYSAAGTSLSSSANGTPGGAAGGGSGGAGISIGGAYIGI
jgi:hypothetical protein